MSLAALISRFGLDKLAEKLGVTPQTLKRWLRQGPSKKGAEALATIAKKTASSEKSRKRRAFRRDFKSTLQLPSQRQEIDPENTLPERPPQGSRDLQKIKRDADLSQRRQPIKTANTSGYTLWIDVFQDVREVDIDDLVSRAVMIFEDSGLNYVSTKFLFLRYIPFNPMYTGEMLVKQGKWHEQFTSSAAVSAVGGLARYMENLLLQSLDWAETRIIFLGMIGVSVFNRHRDIAGPRL